MIFVVLTVVAAVLGLIVNEVYAWLPWLAALLIKRAARFLPEEHRERYEEEWLAELETLPTKGFTSLLFALGVVISVRKTARALTERTRSSIRKRALDVSASAGMLLAVAPILVFTTVLVRLDSRGPIFFRQPRVGRDGRSFAILKFRTMVISAEGHEDELRHLDERIAFFAFKSGLRVTRVGRVLRRLSLDELPLLFNVMRGEMALVGPPPRVLDAPPLDGVLAKAKPGMTSWTSLARVGYLPAEAAHRRDVQLATAWTLRGELTLLLATVHAALTA